MSKNLNEDLRLCAQQAAAKAIKLLGGPVEAAKKVGAPSYQSIQCWVRDGVPPKYCLRINELVGVPLVELRPSDWSSYWPAEIAQVDAQLPNHPSP